MYHQPPERLIELLIEAKQIAGKLTTSSNNITIATNITAALAVAILELDNILATRKPEAIEPPPPPPPPPAPPARLSNGKKANDPKGNGKLITKIVTSATMIIIATAVILTITNYAEGCKAKGGRLVRGIIGWECVGKVGAP